MVKIINLSGIFYYNLKKAKRTQLIKFIFYFLDLAALSEVSRSFNQSVFAFLIAF